MHHPAVTVQLDGQTEAVTLQPESGIPGEGKQGQRHEEAKPRVAGSNVLLFVSKDQLLLAGASALDPRGQNDARAQDTDHRGTGVAGPEHGAIPQRTGLP